MISVCVELLKWLNVFACFLLLMFFQEGFDDMEPFVPVSVSNYNEKEFESCYLYYLDRNWLQHPHSKFVYLFAWSLSSGNCQCCV